MSVKSVIALAASLVLNMTPLCLAASEPSEHVFKTSDRVTLHYKKAGEASRTLVFVPGWLMPGDVFRHQMTALSDHYRVVVLDPRGQGKSQVKVRDMSAQRRADDVRELVRHLKLQDYVLVGWSLGVMEILETITRHPMPGLKGLVLIDNSIGMGPPPPQMQPGRRPARPVKPEAFRHYVGEFSKAIFKRPPEDGLIDIVQRSATQLAPSVAWRLLDKPHHRDYYKQAVLATSVPLWYAITPRYRVQADELMQLRPEASVTVFEDAGHALFVDSAGAFNAALLDFLSRLD
jgi:microsomal epoxide hydrolase